jgi:hypothetical protein
MPKNIRNLELSSGVFSCEVAGSMAAVSEVEEAAGASAANPPIEPAEVEVMVSYISRSIGRGG